MLNNTIRPTGKWLVTQGKRIKTKGMRFDVMEHKRWVKAGTGTPRNFLNAQSIWKEMHHFSIKESW
jgi:hypothetical protein